MGKAQRRRGNTSKNKQYQRIRKSKHKTKDIDEIVEDLKPQNVLRLTKEQALDEDLPGLGQHYCVFCARYFVNSGSLSTHYKTKEHKKRVKRTKEEPYTIEDSKRFAGMEG